MGPARIDNSLGIGIDQRSGLAFANNFGPTGGLFKVELGLPGGSQSVKHWPVEGKDGVEDGNAFGSGADATGQKEGLECGLVCGGDSVDNGNSRATWACGWGSGPAVSMIAM